MGPTWDPTGFYRPQMGPDGPMMAPLTLLSGLYSGPHLLYWLQGVLGILMKRTMVFTTHGTTTALTTLVLAISTSRSFFQWLVTHWGRVTHICVSKLTIIGIDNGLSPSRCQAIILTNAGMLLIRTFGTNVGKFHTFSFKKMHLKMSTKWGLFCLALDVLTTIISDALKRLYWNK